MDSNIERPIARITEVEMGSPAYDAGFEAGCALTSVDGMPIRDMIDWRWLSAEEAIEVGYIDLDGEEGTVELERGLGQDWGFTFDGAVFDGVKTCRNACVFCFMRQLPSDMRDSLTLRDDDFRLSFLEGTFSTLTNVGAKDEARIIEQRISPLRVSLHASDLVLREKMIGKHHKHGLDVLCRLLDAGIEFDAQIVLVPGMNDGPRLMETLQWAYSRPGIRNVGIVPVGFTSSQDDFQESYDDPQAALEVLKLIGPFQERAQVERGFPWVYAADEFYCNAYGDKLLDHIPSTPFYGDFSMFMDGIGIVRSGIDAWESAEDAGEIAKLGSLLKDKNIRVYSLCGESMKGYANLIVERMGLHDRFEFVFVKNRFFGGNVSVTGLLCGCDLAKAAKDVLQDREGVGSDSGSGSGSGPKPLVAIPDVVLNADGVTLDDMTLDDIKSAVGANFADRLIVVGPNPLDYIEQISRI